MHCALLLAVALQLEPSPPYHGEAATLTITTQGETQPLRVDLGSAAMLRRVPDGATVERMESNLYLNWHQAPEHARVELVLRAGTSHNRLDVTALSGRSTATLGVTPLWRDPPSLMMPARRLIPIVLAGLALSLLMWPTFGLLRRIDRTGGVIIAVFGTALSILFVSIWWNDYAATRNYREGRCVITDRMLVFRGGGSKKRPRAYAPMYAVELPGGPRIAGDSDSFVQTFGEGAAQAQLRRFEIGKAYPCWWSVRDRDEVLLEPRRRRITRTSLVTAAICLLLIVPGWLRSRPRPRRRR